MICASRLVLMALVVAIVVSCSPEPELRVLFIGKSYTASNDLPGWFAIWRPRRDIKSRSPLERQADGG